MKRSTQRILTTHVGSLPHPKELHEMLQARETGAPVDTATLDATARQAVADIVKQQADAGISVVNDGEQGKSSWSAYVKDRLNGFEGSNVPRPVSLDARLFPDYTARRGIVAAGPRPACNGPVSWKDFAAVQKDIDNLKAATKGVAVEEAFITASSPGNISNFHPNRYYATEEQYLFAVADVMKQEYEAIVNAGLIVQFDCPDLALSSYFPDLSVQEFRKIVAMRVEALNYATRDIEPDSMRMHVCWGRGEAPKYHDVPLKDIIDLLLQGRPIALSIVGANARHEYEWRVWKDVKIPDGKVLIPGVIDNTTNIVEHPETVADRLINYAGVVGRENVIGGVDCGFGNSPVGGDVVPSVAWAKLRSLAEGAKLASDRLW